MDRIAAAQFLGVSPRTIERYVRDKKLAMEQVNGRPNFSEEELNRFKKESSSPIYSPRKDVTLKVDTGLTVSDLVSAASLTRQADAIAHYYRISSLQQKLVITLPEAQEISGLSQSLLISSIRSGKLKARKLGRGWKIRLSDLQEFIKDEFEDPPFSLKDLKAM